ncbi:hemerythrin domain-containing protein [Shewanella sp. D64]|uniref:hemerythrin domain-containing protein n=1 Tax=unclassified Shewanella TaxID=196818 RepID=UPI0022BA1F5A|nr:MULTISPECIES: hemerythrin domain-containing protein [unclassified Shewanella]MEC4727825.1 hemerythrin domain-containing protein [Shewanella sp. D64]MEC4739362.1 hemerythrin domain-containing protein [Shewanella sp. E94]WBJ96981.1 hemerythrin domain-containing protein [Shewanella sp. MTB7]
MLARLNNDHKHIAILLNILKVKYGRLELGEAVNYNLIRDIVEYMQSYAEHSHHPLEDIINQYYMTKYSSEVGNDKLLREHQKMIALSASLMTSLNLILSDVVVPKEQLVMDLKSYVTEQEGHMAYENSIIFPLWSKMTDEEDWKEIGQECYLKLVDDPLFNGNDNTLFEELREYINLSETN